MWRDSDFRRLWAGQTASQLGEQTSLVILPLIAVVALHVDAGQLGVLRAVGQAPQLLLALFAGVWVDRWQSRTVMVLADLGRALALGTLLVIAGVGGAGLLTLLIVGFVVGALSVMFDVAYQTSLVRLVPRQHLLRGNSAIEGSRSAAQLGGPALGGVLTSLLPGLTAVALPLLFFLGSVVALTRIQHRERVPPRTADPARVHRQIHGGLRFVAGHSLLRTVCLASAAFQLSYAALMTAFLLFLPRVLHLPGTAIGLVLAAAGLGALLGSLLAARLPSRLGYGPVLVAAAAIGNGAMLCIPAVRGNSTLAVAALVAINLTFGALSQLVNVTIMAVRQAITPPRLQGRTAATITFVGMGTTPLGALLGGYLTAHLGTRPALLITAAGLMLSPLTMVVSPLGRLGRSVD
ncbi:MFS transporter [Actinoplanes sp. N902-109]|uniref:MFS transporter n=1 Tax=Actinoplanes sp. (strain N902-109) TaxID=649831 RepID=UPI0003294844|nr:MFS transporter [Actinoplanes sp. N902-109]AGL18943.1 major facilitator superfamily transporter [Actinoplanes sp. N902-109]